MLMKFKNEGVWVPKGMNGSRNRARGCLSYGLSKVSHRAHQTYTHRNSLHLQKSKSAARGKRLPALLPCMRSVSQAQI